MKLLCTLILLCLSAKAVSPTMPIQSDRHRYLQWSNHLETPIHPETNYLFYHEIHKNISHYVNAYPGIIRPFSIGKTVENRTIWAFSIHNPIYETRHKILIFAGLHPLEWVGMDATVSIIENLVLHPPKHTEVVVIPVINIDRRLLVEKDLVENHRKYRRSNSGNEDLNREFEIHRDATAIWRYLYPERYSVSSAPLSQPESRAIDALAKEYQFDASVSLHCFGGYIYYPWAGRYQRPPNWKELDTIATYMKKAQSNKRPYRVKQLSHWMFLFRAQGTELDHLYGKYGTNSFLIEIGRSGVELLDKDTWHDPFRLYNPIDPSIDIRRTTESVLGLVRYYESL